MSDEKPYGDTYLNKFLHLHKEQEKAASQFAAQTLYLREESAGKRTPGARPQVRKRLAEEAAQEWLRLAHEIEELNRIEYAKKEEKAAR